MKKIIVSIAIAIIAISVIVFAIHAYNSIAAGICPICGATIVYRGEVLNNQATMYRYTCTEHAWHMIDLWWMVQ